MDYEDPATIQYGWWKDLPIGDLLRLRYTLGVRLRCTYPRPAHPSYLYDEVRVINRILDERGWL